MAPLKLQLLRQTLTQITHRAHVTTAPTITDFYETKAHSLCLSTNKTRHLCFYKKDFYRITSLPSHFSLPSLQHQRKTSLGFENMAWCQGKKCQFWFRHLFQRFKMMLTGSFMASKISSTVQLQAVGFALVQTVSVYIWALNTDLKLHHKETTDLPRVHWSLTSYCLVGNKKNPWIPNVIFLNQTLPKVGYKTYFLPISCTVGSYRQTHSICV